MDFLESTSQVSSSCTSVYLDGSEVRGSTNATLVARYGSAESTGSLTVWVPEMPLDVQLDDVKLNQIAGWRVASAASPPAAGAACRPRYQQTPFEVRPFPQQKIDNAIFSITGKSARNLTS